MGIAVKTITVQLEIFERLQFRKSQVVSKINYSNFNGTSYGFQKPV